MRIEHLISDGAGTVRVTDHAGTYAATDIRRFAAGVCQWLSARGVRRNDRVVLCAENGVHFIAGMFGILQAGATVVPVDPGLPAAAIQNILKATQAVSLCDAGTIQEAYATGQRHPVMEASLSADDPAFILFSSGTTGQPKGVVLSHRAILANMRAIAGYLQPSAADDFYIAKSMVHSSTITGEILVAFYTGAGIIAFNPLAPFRQTVQRLEERRASILCIPPSLLHFFTLQTLDAERLKGLHTIHVSGSIINKEDFRKVKATFPHIRLFNGYGLTETGPRVTQTCGPGTITHASAGKPIQGVQVAVRDGEIYVKSDAMMDGYWINGRIDGSMIVEGWLPAGDLGYMDENGELVVTGRKDDMIITSSHNVMPADIETVVLQLEGIDDCIVFAEDDDVLGQRIICAYISESITDNNRLRAWCSERLSAWQVPKNFYRWPSIPVNSNGKRSRALAKQYLAERRAAPQPMVSVVIPVFNQLASLQTVLRFFNYQTYPAASFEVIVVDDGSQEPVRHAVSKDDYRYALQVITTHNRGRASARNTGVRHAAGKLIVFCDADRIPDPALIEVYYHFLTGRRHAAAFGCPWDCFLTPERIRRATEADIDQLKRFSRKTAYYKKITALYTGAFTGSPVAWAAFLAGNSAVMKNDFLAAGSFDETFRSWGFEHFDLAIRLRQQGVQICHLPEAASYHIAHPRDQEALERDIRASAAMLGRKYPGTNAHLVGSFVRDELSLEAFESANSPAQLQTIN